MERAQFNFNVRLAGTTRKEWLEGGHYILKNFFTTKKAKASDTDEQKEPRKLVREENKMLPPKKRTLSGRQAKRILKIRHKGTKTFNTSCDQWPKQRRAKWLLTQSPI